MKHASFISCTYGQDVTDGQLQWQLYSQITWKGKYTSTGW